MSKQQQKQDVKKGFDYRTHVKDKDTGEVVQENHYRLSLSKDGSKIERPIGSGRWFNMDGTEIQSAAKPEPQRQVQSVQAKAPVAPTTAVTPVTTPVAPTGQATQ